MSSASDPQTLVPPGSVFIGVRIHHKSGRASHSMLMHQDVDPALLEKILNNARTMEIRKRKFPKARLPPQKKGGEWRSYPHRIVVRGDSATTNLGPAMARTLIRSCIRDLLEQVADAGAPLEEVPSPLERRR